MGRVHSALCIYLALLTGGGSKLVGNGALHCAKQQVERWADKPCWGGGVRPRQRALVLIL